MLRVFYAFCFLGSVLFLSGCAQEDSPAQQETAAEKKPNLPRSKEPNWTAEEIGFLEEKFGALQVTTSGLRYKVLSPGEGTATPEKAASVEAHYRGMFLSGDVFDESLRSGKPLKFRVGLGRVIAGWDESILTMKRGEKRLVVVPWWLGYGERGRPPRIPSRTHLVFEIELLGWETTRGIPSSNE